jgi:hypothetical protein
MDRDVCNRYEKKFQHKAVMTRTGFSFPHLISGRSNTCIEMISALKL